MSKGEKVLGQRHPDPKGNRLEAEGLERNVMCAQGKNESYIDMITENEYKYLGDLIYSFMVTTDLGKDGFIFLANRNHDVVYARGTKKAELLMGEALGARVLGDNTFSLMLAPGRTIRVMNAAELSEVMRGEVCIVMPLEINGNMYGSVGLVVSHDRTSELYLDFFENILKTAVAAAVKVYTTRQTMDELHIMKNYYELQEAGVAVIALNNELKVIKINSHAERLLGRIGQRMVGRSLLEFCSIDRIPGFINDESPFFQKIELRDGMYSQVHESEWIAVKASDIRIVGWIVMFAGPQVTTMVNSRARFSFDDIITRNEQFRRLIKLAKAVASSASNVLITGESGTGKELFAQAIHAASQRRAKPFIALNCAAIPRELIETELFGYVEGAFTGARKGGMKGKFVLADGGTLFLDEIGDMPIDLQPKLLRVLQERTIVPVGGVREIPVDIRLISATNQDIEEMVAQKVFRQDLYYRLNVIHLAIPPLRERKEDIPLLVEHFIRVYSRMLGKEVNGITPQALQALIRYEWPGNVRELENTIELAVNITDTGCIDVEHLPNRMISTSGGQEQAMEQVTPIISANSGIVPLEEVERREIIKALLAFDGNVTQAANALKIGRTTLYRKINRFGLQEMVRQ